MFDKFANIFRIPDLRKRILFTLGLLAGATHFEAAELANRASGMVVGKLGTATVSPAELEAGFR